MSTVTLANAIAKIGDVIRGSLLVDRPEQIPILLKSVTERVTAQGGKFFIKNFWADPKPLSLGYVGVHIKIRIPIPSKETNKGRRSDQTGSVDQERKYILMELQLHIREIMDGTKDCAKEIAHFLYKVPREAEEKISSELISSSQLVYLTAMTRLLASKEDLEKIEDTLHIIQAMTKADKKMRLVMETAMLLGNKQLKGEWNEQLQVVVPKDKDAVAVAWMGTAEKINKLLNLPIVKMDKNDAWTNTATSVDELYADATQIVPFFRDMCEQVAKSQPGCSANFGPGNKHMIKEKPSLLDKIKEDYEEELGRFMPQLLMKIGRSLFQIAESTSVCLERLSVLQSLNFSGCSQITNSDLSFLEGLSALQSLRLSGCNQITDEGLVCLKRLTGLRSLDLSNCQITNQCLAHLENLIELQSLNLAYCRLITDEGLIHLWRLSGLQSLNLYGCDKITDGGLARARLQSLNLSRIPNTMNPKTLFTSSANSYSTLELIPTAYPAIPLPKPMIEDSHSELKANPNQTTQLIQLAAVSESTQSTKDTYVGLLLRLLKNSSVKSDSSLVELLESQVEDLMDQETQVLTPKQKICYQWTQKLLVDEEVSQLIAKNLRKLHASDEGKRPLVVLHTSAHSSQTPSASQAVSTNLASLGKDPEASLREAMEILIKIKKYPYNGLKSLAELTDLKLSSSQITDSDLDRLVSLVPMLQSLDISHCNQITDRGLASLAGLTDLRSLGLFGCNKLTDSVFAILGSLTALQSLNLSFCQITDRGLASLAALTALQSLNISYCKLITDRGLASLGGLTALQNLNLDNCNLITDSGLASLGSLTALQSLILNGCKQITDGGLASLSGLTALQSLDFFGCGLISDKGLASLKRLTALQRLSPSSCMQITDRGWASLESLPVLTSLNISYCYQISDSGFASLGRLTALQSLDLTFCDITDRGLASLGGLSALQSLKLPNCKKITGIGFASLGHLTALQSLDLNGCTLITDKGFASLGGLTRLKNLNLMDCKQITDRDVISLVGLTMLQSLCVQSCNLITDTGLAWLGRLTALQSLDISYCKLITDRGVASLGGLTALRQLTLRECSLITAAIAKSRLSTFCSLYGVPS